MMNKFRSVLIAGSFIGLLATGCSKDDDGPNPGTEPETHTESKYVIEGSSLSGGLSGPSYILTADDISSGTINITGNGVELHEITSAIFQNNTLFSLVYGLTAQGPITTYKLDADGKLAKGVTLNVPTANVFGRIDDDAIITCAVPRELSSPMANFTVIDAVNPQIKKTASLNAITLREGTGEMASFNALTKVGDKIFAPYMSIGGTGGTGGYGSKYLDSTWIAVLSYPELAVEKIIKDNRTSYIGAYFGMFGVDQLDNGDVYTFSTAPTGSTKPSAVLKIKNGTTEFDKSYFFNLEAASGGHKLVRSSHISGNLFLAEMYDEVGKASGKVRLAIVDVVNATFEWVSGSPTYSAGMLNTPTYVEDDGKSVVVPISETPNNFTLYIVDATSKSAKKGAEIKGMAIFSAISKLTY